jgi:hypothetical protein
MPIAILAKRSIMDTKINHAKELIMSMQSEGKDAKGRNYDNVTKQGSTSSGNAQADVRTDDLLSDGSDQDSGGGFVREEGGEIQTGMAGIGSLSTGNAGSRQSAGDARPEGDALNDQKQK